MFATAAPPPEERRAQYDVDYTPRAVPRLTIARLGQDIAAHPERILIPSAGAGSWAAEARAAYPDAHITAVEIRPEERAHLWRWCDEVHIGDIRDPSIRADIEVEGPIDLICDNPAFSLIEVSDCPHVEVVKSRCVACGERKSQAEALRAFVVNLRPLLVPRTGRLALYHLSDLGQRSADAWKIIEEHPPMYQMRVMPMSHRGDGKSDARSYSVWAWGPGPGRSRKQIVHEPATWKAWSLPRLGPSERRWTTVPGTETT